MAKQILVKKAYDLWADQYESDGNPMMALEEKVFKREFNKPLPEKKVLDLGCGTGRHSAAFIDLGAKVTAADFSENMLKKAKEKIRSKNIRFIRHDIAKRLPFRNKYFDIISCSLVLEHIKKLDFVFKEMKRVCKSDGYIFVTEMHPDMRKLGKQASFTDKFGKKYNPTSYPHTIESIKQSIEKTGLHIEKFKTRKGTKTLAKKTKRAAKYVGYPMLLEIKIK